MTNRRAVPQSRLSSVLGRALLLPVPSGGVLVLAGDNDSYAVWFAQHVGGLRPDVVPVTISLLPAKWYRRELSRRHNLLTRAQASVWTGTAATLRDMAQSGRPIAVAAGLPVHDRAPLGDSWFFDGLTYLRRPSDSAGVVPRDTLARALSSFILSELGPHDAAASLLPTEQYLVRLLQCPAALVTPAATRSVAARALLETTCNYR